MPKPLRVLLLTRTNRLSGICMAQALHAAGVSLIGIVAERRMSLVLGKKGVGTATRKILAQHGFGAVLKKLLAQAPSLEEWAVASNIPFALVDDHNGPDAQTIIRKMQPDLIVLCNTRRISSTTFTIAPRGALNLHLSLLPRYAGLDSIFWALYHREKELGFSIHRVAEQLDAGDVLYQGKVVLTEIPDEGKLYEELLRKGCDAMARIVQDLDIFERRAVPQDSSRATYFSWPTPQQRRWYRRFRNELFGREPLKILHLITRMVRGGAQENTLATVIGLRQQGYNAVLATGPSLGPEGSMEEDIVRAGIPCTHIKSLVRQPSGWKDLCTLIHLVRWMRKEKFLVVHTHTSKAGAIGRLAARLAGVPNVIHTPHGHVFEGYFSSPVTRGIIRAERWLARHSDRLIALTEKEKQEHLALGIGSEGRFATIPSGVPLKDFDPVHAPDARRKIRAEFGISENAKVIGTMARLVPVKGVKFLLNAFRQIASAHANTFCLIAGDGPQRAALENIAQEYGIAQRVRFAGYRKDVADVLAAMDVFVLASLNEGMGRAIVQAGLMRKAIVASAVSGIQDLIQNGQNGILVAPGDPEVLARELEHVLNNEALAENLGSRAREIFLSRYGEDQMIDDIALLYDEVLAAKGTPRHWLKSGGTVQDIPGARAQEWYGREYEKLSC